MNATIGLEEQYQQLKKDQPKLRIRDAAKILGVSEAELVALGISKNVVRLTTDWHNLLEELHTLGTVMALTRNDDAVHERHGVYTNISFQGAIGLVVNADIDLRLFLMHWEFAFAVDENGRKSIQIFDKSGDAVHKIYCTDKTNIVAYEQIVKKYAAKDKGDELVITPYSSNTNEVPDTSIDVEVFQNGWKALKDTHDFHQLLKDNNVSRLQAMRLAPQGYAIKVGNEASRKLLQSASEQKIPIMIFVSNRGCVQIHTGLVEKLLEAGPWYNVLDEEFSLHLRESNIAYSYVVTKPSVDGAIHSVEMYDSKGELIIQFFGKRKPGQMELPEWQNLTNELISQLKITK